SKIGVIDGAGNSDQERSYTYTDYAPFGGISYYQLKQVDFDGTSTVSEIRSVKTKLKVDDMFSVFLDREKNLEISAYAGKDTKGTLHVTNMSGNAIIVKEVSLKEGYNKF